MDETAAHDKIQSSRRIMVAKLILRDKEYEVRAGHVPAGRFEEKQYRA